MLKTKKALDYSLIKHTISTVTPLRDRAFCAIHYAFACRVGETIQINQENLVRETPNAYFFNVPNLKNRTKAFKQLPLLKREAWLVTPVMRFFKQWPRFDLKDRSARNLLKKHFGYSSHYLRHSRLTHLVELFDFNPEKELVDFAGWENSKPAKIYLHLSKKYMQDKADFLAQKIEEKL